MVGEYFHCILHSFVLVLLFFLEVSRYCLHLGSKAVLYHGIRDLSYNWERAYQLIHCILHMFDLALQVFI